MALAFSQPSPPRHAVSACPSPSEAQRAAYPGLLPFAGRPGWAGSRSDARSRAPPCAPGAGRVGSGRRELGVARSLWPPLCLTASSLPFLKLKGSLDTKQFDLCAGSVSGGRWRSWSGSALGRYVGTASTPGLSGAGGGGTPGPPPRGPDLPACPWGVSVRCARGCWVVSSPQPLC